MIEQHLIAAELILRVLLGVIFFSQGYDKVFRMKVSGVIKTFEYPLQLKQLPRFPLVLAAYYTSYVELVAGLFLIVGFMKIYALYLLGLDLLIVVTAFSLMHPVWNMKHVFPRIVMLIALLIIPPSWSILSVDYLLMLLKLVRQITY